MSGRGGRGGAQGGPRGGRAGRGGRGRGHGYHGTNSTAKQGLCSGLGTHVFNYGTKGAADQMRTTWEKLVQYIGTNYGQDISNELSNKAKVVIPEPEYLDGILNQHADRAAVVIAGQQRLGTGFAEEPGTGLAKESGQEPAPEPTICRSTRTRKLPKQHIPSMGGSRYDYAMAQLTELEVLNPDALIFMHTDFYRTEADIVEIMMTQLSLKTGIRTWGKRARAAAYKEMNQLHQRNTFKPMHYKDLTSYQKQMLLESHMFLKEKRDSKIKGRTVAGGDKQRDYISKEDVSLPTVSNEAVLLTCIVDA